MKTTRILLLAATFLLFPWCAAQLFSQQEGSKKIVITKRTIDADGAESSETLVKKGPAAENFDVEKYIRENRADNTRLDLKITGGDDERTIVIKGSKSIRNTEEDEEEDDDNKIARQKSNRYDGYRGYEGYGGYNSGKDKGAFLGVAEDSDEKSDKPGLVVNVVRGSAADRAGLRDNDKIMKLNETPMNQWSDLSKFVNAAKVGDKLRISYERNGKAAFTEATLTRRSDLKNERKREPNTSDWDIEDFDPMKWVEGVFGSNGNCTVNVSQKDACLGVYSDAFSAGDEEGSRINDFTDSSAAREVNMATGDVITAINGQRVKNHDELWNEIAKFKVGDKVKVNFLREGKTLTAEPTLKACRDNSSRVQILDNDGGQVRDFTSWNWSEGDQRLLRERSIIKIRRGEGDASKVNSLPATQDRSLQIPDFRAYPNPTQSQVTVAFTSEAVATTVSFFDLSGRQLFREELNVFNGRYNQQFDLSEYAKGTIIIHVQQGEKVFTEQTVVN